MSMSPEQENWLKSVMTKIGRRNLDRAAEIDLLKEAVVGLISESQPRGRIKVMFGIDQKIQTVKGKYLLTLEGISPVLAAEMGAAGPGE